MASAYHSSRNNHIQEGEMGKTTRAGVLVAVLLGAVLGLAQNPNYDVGPVWRVTYMHVKPGMGDVFWNDFRQHIKPVLDEQKKAGLISDYKAFTNPVTNSPNDWDVALGVLYSNWAALDQIDAKAASIVVKHYGSREAALEAAKKRSELREVVGSHLAREVMSK
jgi:ABC-type sugar transport system substrate-binding protein